MKQWIAIILCMLMLVTAAACAKKPEPSPAPAAETSAPKEETISAELPEPANEEAPAGAIVGGWMIAEDPALTDALRALFEKGLAELVGVDYVPIALLGTQVVAGTNYCFLAQGTVVYPDAAPKYMLVYLYEDLSGNVSVLDIEDMPIVAEDDGTLSVPAEPGTLMGGWAYADTPAVTDEIRDRFNKALEGLVGADYEPIANLGTQVVAGLNRCILCKVTPVVPDAVSHWALAYVYEDLEGGASLNNVVDFVVDVPERTESAEPVAEEQRPDEPTMSFEYFTDDKYAPAAAAGGWQVSLEPEMTDALTAIFEKALEGLVGVDYVPVACLGTQIVAGTNYCFLAKATVVYPNAQPTYVLLYVYEDLSGNVEILNFADMPVVPNEYGTAEPIPAEEALDGGWYYTESFEITQKIEEKFGEALNSYGYLAVYAPVANLAEQIVAGTNRCLLVRFTERIPNALPQYKLMYVYEALDGSAEITDALDFDISDLCTYGA